MRRYGAAYAIFFLVGMGTLIPWNVFITARAYFDLRLFKPPYTPALSDSFESIFGIAFMTTNLAALAVFVRVGGVAALPPFAQVPAPLLVMSVLLAFTGVLTFAGGLSGNAMTAWTLATLLLLGAVTAVVQGGSFAMASNLPPAYNQALMGGQAVAGVLSAVVAMVSTLSLSGGGGGGEGSGRRDDRHDNTTAGRTGKYMTSSGEEEGGIGAKVGDDSSSRAASQAAAYFFTAAALMFACFVGGLFLERVPFYRHHVAAAAAARRGDNERESRRKQPHERQRPRHVAGSGADWDETSAVPLLGRMEEEDEEDEDCRSGDDVYLEASGDDSTHEEEGRSEYVSASEGGGDRSLSPPSPTSRSSSPSSPAPSSAASDVRCYRVSVFVTFAVTLAVFPAVTSSICSARNPAVIPPCAPDPPGAGGRFFGDLWAGAATHFPTGLRVLEAPRGFTRHYGAHKAATSPCLP
jgi:equilibrative nucleoside transporter 1/2/3